MTKKNQKVYSYAANWLKYIGHDEKDILTKLDITKNELEQLMTEQDDTIVKNKKDSTVKKLMTSNTTNKNNKITVMSKEASEITDSLKNKTSQSRDTSSFIFKPNSK